MPDTPLTDEERAGLGIPRTLRRIADDSAVQRPLFDPALKHLPNAFRASDPDFGDPADRAAWLTARRAAMDLVLAAVARSPWRDHLVLRGSVLLAQWFGAAAREPGDLDFVVVPAEWRIEDGRTEAMLDGIARAAARLATASTARGRAGPPVRFGPDDAVSEDIWTYDRVPGRRLVLPWACEGTPGGIVQLDFVFNESLPVPPRDTEVAGCSVLAATPGLSLAWKLVWLVTDMHPQGKDLYDAVLLAEHCTLDYGTLGEVFIASDPYYAAHPVAPGFVDGTSLWEWEHFAAEYPSLASARDGLVARLNAALAPTFRAVDDDRRAAHRVWSAAWLGRCRAAYAAGGADGLLADLTGQGAPAAVAVAVLRAFLGDAAGAPAETIALLLRHPAWAATAAFDDRLPDFTGSLTTALRTLELGL
ncbi:nucleotidyl transferase AbiEii/AbiGii toxin family protein [Actinacidiphila alni]|uniref:nucleotidyl transferase AbiEii/AbiGii toxin family protein n=1 Tax=Actinacidiphila alni TaxID=380248 RepID=UPI003451196D